MKKAYLACLTLVLALTAFAGCRAEAEIDPDGKVSYNQVLPR